MSDEVIAKLSRWSQRKLAARRGAAVDDVSRDGETPPSARADQTPAVTAPASTSADAAPEAEAEIPELPSIEGLTFESDYTVFLAENVPETLRRAALRKLWVSDPVLANLDGLNDYCEDLNIVDTPITLAQTSYKVGRGFLDEIEEKVEGELIESGEQLAGADSQSDAIVSEDKSTAGTAGTEDAAPGEMADMPADAPRRLAAGEPAGEPSKDVGKT